jgi:hypothetical protein
LPCCSAESANRHWQLVQANPCARSQVRACPTTCSLSTVCGCRLIPVATAGCRFWCDSLPVMPSSGTFMCGGIPTRRAAHTNCSPSIWGTAGAVLTRLQVHTSQPLTYCHKHPQRTCDATRGVSVSCWLDEQASGGAHTQPAPTPHTVCPRAATTGATHHMTMHAQESGVPKHTTT